jgi:ribosomal protein S18 acetylase RimI-like enzyme
MQLSQLAERTFRDTFGNLNTAGNIDLHCTKSYSKSIQAAEIANPTMATVLCEEQGILLGFAQLRWDSVPECVVADSPGEIQRLYVDGEWHGKGIAQELMIACLEEMKEHGSDVVWLGVWERNPRAIAFYRKFGFVEVGEHIFPLGADPQRDIVMVRPNSL